MEKQSYKIETPVDLVEETLTEGINERLPSLKIDIPDDELAANIDLAVANANSLHDDIKKIQDQNENYWLGEQWQPEKFQTKNKVRTIENRIFLSLETLIPIVTDRTPEPLVFSDSDDYEFSRNLERVLMGKYQEQNMAAVFEVVVRNWALYRLGCTKLVHDTVTDDFMITYSRPQRLTIDKRGTDESNSRFVRELVDEPFDVVLEKFADKREEIMRYLNTQTSDSPIIGETPVYYSEFWTNEMVAWKLGPIICDKSKNPLWDWENEDNNFLIKPVKPYFFMNGMFTLGKTVYDDTSLVEQNKSVQDGINKMHWSISDDLADRGTIIGSGDGISKDELAKYKGEAGEKIHVSKGQPRQFIDRLDPKNLSPQAIPYKQDLDQQSDSIMGTHGTLRGERQGQETFSGRALLKEQDTGRAAPISRIFDRMAGKVYNAMVQYMKLYYTAENYVPYVAEDGAAELLKINASEIKQGMRIQVRAGSSLPLDKYVQRNEAMELATQNRIDPITLFERLGWPKPVESAKKVFLYDQVVAGKVPADILFPGITQEIQQKMTESQEAGQSIAQEDAGMSGNEGASPLGEGLPQELMDILGSVNSEGGEEFVPPQDEVAAGLAAARGVNGQP